jgi:type IV pilus assembly protein PilE
MNTINSKRNSGFTIIELMIVLVIVAILLALAYPSYVDYVRRANRGEAQQMLLNWAVNQEIWRANNPTYASEANLPPPNHDKFNFNLDASSATAFAISATALGDQANDKARDGTPCGVLNLNSAGQKYSGGDTTKISCWD